MTRYQLFGGFVAGFQLCWAYMMAVILCSDTTNQAAVIGFGMMGVIVVTLTCMDTTLRRHFAKMDEEDKGGQ